MVPTMGANAQRTGRFGVGVAVVAGVLLVVGAGAAGAAAGPGPVPRTQAAFDSLPSPVPGNYPSLGYQATRTAEFGDLVELAPGTGRVVSAITVGMSSWACQSDLTDPSGPCVSAAGATYQHDLTLTVYAVDTTGTAPAPGAVLWTGTLDAAVPYRPSTSPECTARSSRGWWSATESRCYSGYAFEATFTPAAPLTLPDDVIVTVAFATQSNGGDAGPGPWDSLNYGLVAVTPSTMLAAGTDVDPSVAFLRPEGGALAAAADWTYTPIIKIRTNVDARIAQVVAPARIALGRPVAASATVEGSAIPVGSTVVLAAYPACAVEPVYVSDPLPVSAAGTVGPVTFTPTTTGAVQWVATLADSLGAFDDSTCGDVTTQVLADDQESSPSPTPTPTPALAATGAGSSTTGLVTALAAILLGSVLVLVSRRRPAGR